jgi:hypothetical protein
VRGKRRRINKENEHPQPTNASMICGTLISYLRDMIDLGFNQSVAELGFQS